MLDISREFQLESSVGKLNFTLRTSTALLGMEFFEFSEFLTVSYTVKRFTMNQN